MTADRWIRKTLGIIIAAMVLVVSVIVYVDPFYHYHKPHTDRFYYDMAGDFQRYYNDGILKRFDYDAVIIGTSMTEFYSADYVNSLFDCTSVKTPFSGGEYAEIDRHLADAFKDHNVRYVFRPLDFKVNSVLISEDLHSAPLEYIYNDNLIDDVYYVLNKRVLLESMRIVINSMRYGRKGIVSFDDYYDWYDPELFTKERALSGSVIAEPEETAVFTDQEKEALRKNIRENVVRLASEHPETVFYYYLPPYSIANWASIYSAGELDKRIEEERIMIEMILPCENIHLFSFNLHTDWTTDLLNYCDITHYSPELNRRMLQYMRDDTGRLTAENYEEYLEKEHQFYSSYDYMSLKEEGGKES